MFNFVFNKKKQINIVVLFLFGFVLVAQAGTQKMLPGKFKTMLVSVEAANIINLYLDITPGFPEVYRVTLPGIAVPTNQPDVPACQLDLAQKALDFTNDFLKSGKYIEIRKIKLNNIHDSNAKINIYTDKGSLGSKLKNKGLARPDTVDEEKPWC